MKEFLQNNSKKIIIIFFVILFIFNTIAYSGLATKLSIISEAMFRAQADIRVIDIKLDSSSEGAVESYSPKYNVDTTTTGFLLPNDDSSITYRVSVKNFGNVNQTIYDFEHKSINKDGIIATITPIEEDKDGDIIKRIIYPDQTIDFLITFKSTTPSLNVINVIEYYDFRKVYTIYFDANGGTGGPISQIKYQGETLKLTEDTPTLLGYTFKGWRSELDSNVTYNPGSLFYTEQDTLLYAIWSKVEYNISYNLCYGIKGVNAPVKGTYNEDAIISNPTKTVTIEVNENETGAIIEGETSKEQAFEGWISNSNSGLGSNAKTGTSANPTTSWTGSLTKNTYFKNLRDTIGTVTMEANWKPLVVTLPLVTKEGYTCGWATTNNGKKAYESGSSYTFGACESSVLTLFAKCDSNQYTITLDNSEATSLGTTKIYERYNAGIYLDEAEEKKMTTTENPIIKPEKTGYTFKGYYTGINGAGVQLIDENGYITSALTNTSYSSNTEIYAYFKDETNPTLSLTNSSNENWTNSNVLITLNATDSGSGIGIYQNKYSYTNDKWMDLSDNIDSFDEEINEKIYYRVIDVAGNLSNVEETWIRIDRTPPKIELYGSSSASIIDQNLEVTIPIKITETASGLNSSEFTASDINVLVNGTAVNPSTKTLTYNGVDNGIYSYTLTLGGILLNGNVTLEIASGAVKDIATNLNTKTTLNPNLTISNVYSVILNGNGANAQGTTEIYEKYNAGIYLDNNLTKKMTTNENSIIKPEKYYIVKFNSNNTGVTVPNDIRMDYDYLGYYTDESSGTQMINQNGYITSNFTNTSYTSNQVFYAHWGSKEAITIPAVEKRGYTCSWSTTKDGVKIEYEPGTVTFDLENNQVLDLNCKANEYKVEYKTNSGTGSMSSTKAIFNENVSISSNTFKNEGYTFIGWTTNSDETDDGYNWTGWSGTWTYINGEYGISNDKLVLYARWASKDDIKYTVYHHYQKLDGTYPSESELEDNKTILYGETNSNITVADYKIDVVGFTYDKGQVNGIDVTNTTIAPDGSRVINLYYTRNTYKLTYDSITNGGNTVNETISVLYDAPVDLTKMSTKSEYNFVGWNLTEDSTSALLSYNMPASDKTIYAIYNKTITATFNYYNSQKQNVSVTIYNNTTSGSITSPAALGTPSGYTFRHYSTSDEANAVKTVDENKDVLISENTTYYASYQKTVTLNFYYHGESDTSNTQISTTSSGIQYLSYNGTIKNSQVEVPISVINSTGYYGTTYKGVTSANSMTPISVDTGTTNYYAYYQVGLTFYYYNGSSHTSKLGTRTAYSNGTNYILYVDEPTPSSYDNATYKGWSKSSTNISSIESDTTYYAYYQKSIESIFNYFDGSKAANTLVENTRTYISKIGGINVINPNIDIPTIVKENRGTYTYRGVSASDEPDAVLIVPTTEYTEYYTSYIYAVTVSFDANGGTGTKPSANAGTAYMNYNGEKIGINVTMPENPFTKTGYIYNGWKNSNGTIYNIGSSYEFTETQTLLANWISNEYKINLNGNGASSQGTTAIYERYNEGIYLDSGTNNNLMTTTTNPIPNKPTKNPYTVSFSDNNLGISLPEDTTFTPSFNGYYDESELMINENGYITNNLTNTKYTSDTTLFAKWNYDYVLPEINQEGYTCKWLKESTLYNPGETVQIMKNTTIEASCTVNKYIVSLYTDGDDIYPSNIEVTYNDIYANGTPTGLPLATKSDSNGFKYTFEGWYTSSGVEIKNSSIVKITEDTTLYAHWLSSPIISASTSDWTNGSVTISLESPSISNSNLDISYQVYISTSNSSITGGEWIDITSSDNSYIITENMNKYVYYRAKNSEGIYSKESNFVTVKIDTTVPTTTLTAYKTGTQETVESGNWSNKYLEFKMGAITAGPSGGIGYYCIQDDVETDSEVCEPTNIIAANTAIPVAQTNQKAGEYTVRYKVVNGAGMESEIFEYKAKVDVTAPIVLADISSDDTLLATLQTGVLVSKEWTEWTQNSYSIDASGSYDNGGSGIDKVEVKYNNTGFTSKDSTGFNTISTTKDISTSKNDELSGNGARYVEIHVYDLAGNSSSVSFIAYIDNTKPEIELVVKNKSGAVIESDQLSSTGLIYTITVKKYGPSGYTVYTCSNAEAGCTPSNKISTTNDVGTVTAYQNVTTFDRYVNIKATSGAGIDSDIASHHSRVGTVDVDIDVFRTDNGKRVASNTWVNSTVKFKLTTENSSSTLKYCVDQGNTCSPKNTVTSGTFVSLTNTLYTNKKLYIRYNADDGTVHSFVVGVDLVAPSITLSAYKLSTSSNTATGSLLKTVTDGNLSITDWVNYGYYFDLDGSADSGGSGIASMKWAYNDSGSYEVVHETSTTTTYNSIKNVYFKATGYRYGEITLTDKAGNTKKVAIGVRIDKVAPKLVVKMYKATESGGRGAGIQTVTGNTNTNAWKNYGYYFDLNSTEDHNLSKITAEYNPGGNPTMDTSSLSSKNITSDKSIVVTGDGARYIKFTATDSLNNSSSLYIKFYIDKTPPSLTWGSESYNGSSMTVSYTCADNYSQLKNSSGSKVATLKKSITLNGTGTAKATCTDRAGNSSSDTKKYTWGPSSSACGIVSQECTRTVHYDNQIKEYCRDTLKGNCGTSSTGESSTSSVCHCNVEETYDCSYAKTCWH